MYATCRFLIVLALGIGLVGVPAARADDKKPEKVKPAAEPGKPLIIQIDASKLPPDVLKQLLQLAEPVTKPGVKPGTEFAKPGTKPTPGSEKPGFKPGTKPGAEVVKPGTKPTGEPVKPGTKPGMKPGTEFVKPGTKPTGDKPGVKVISLADAIAIAEKATQHTATKAERKTEDGTVQFKVELQDGKGGKTKVTLDATGKVTDNEQDDEKGGAKKKKG